MFNVDFARSTSSLLNPKLPAINIALLAPGIPIVSLYVGCKVSLSNSTHAFLNLEFVYSIVFNSPKWVVVTHNEFFEAKSSRITSAREAPSWGSVPAQISSNTTSVFSSAVFNIFIILFMCDENVDKFCIKSCSSPISASIFSNG